MKVTVATTAAAAFAALDAVAAAVSGSEILVSPRQSAESKCAASMASAMSALCLRFVSSTSAEV